MDDYVTLRDAETDLDRLITRVEAGETIGIIRAGRVVAALSPLHRRTEPRRPGSWKGRVTIADDFDAPLDGFDA